MKILFTLYVNSLKKSVPWKTSERILLYFKCAFDKSASPFKLDIGTVHFTTENEGIQREKAAWKLSFRWETRVTHQTNGQNPTTSKHRFKFPYNYFPLKFVCKTSAVVVVVVVVIGFFFLSVHVFFLARFLIDRCQIVTDICTKNVSNFVWKPFKSPFSLHK